MTPDAPTMAHCRLCHAYRAVNAEGRCLARCAKNRAARRALKGKAKEKA